MPQNDKEDRLRILSQCSLFESLDGPTMELVYSCMECETFMQNDFIIKEGTIGNKMFIIVQGRVEIRQELKFHINRALRVFSKGDYFGEVALVKKNQKRFASAVVLEDNTVCLSMARPKFDFILKSNPIVASQITRTMCERDQRNLTNLKADLNNSFHAIIITMAAMAEYRDPETGAHINRVNYYTTELSKKLMGQPGFEQIDDSFIGLIGVSSCLHDIGKVAIPDDILLKPGKLDETEWIIMKRHSLYGAEIMEKSVKHFSYPDFFNMGRNIALYHHEYINGKGYPKGLSGDAIPVEARIMAIADVYDALRSERPYKKPFSHEKARAIILEEKEIRLDGRIVDQFIKQESTFDKIFTENKG